jgi:hypothetical protein
MEIESAKAERLVSELVLCVAKVSVRAVREFEVAGVLTEHAARAREQLLAVQELQRVVTGVARAVAGWSVDWDAVPAACVVLSHSAEAVDLVAWDPSKIPA